MFDDYRGIPCRPPPMTDRCQIEMRVDSDPNRVPAVRVVASDLAARADFDLDAVADLRLAVDEACAALLRAAARGSPIHCAFALTADRLVVTISVAMPRSTISTRTFGWRVLTTLADEVEVLDRAQAAATNGHAGPGERLGIRLTRQRR